MNTRDFKKLMKTVADGWNSYDPKKSVSCFTDDVIYMEPPDKQLVIGKDNLFKVTPDFYEENLYNASQRIKNIESK